MKYAGFWIRFIAFIVDSIIIAIGSAILFSFTIPFLYTNMEFIKIVSVFFIALLVNILHCLYFIVFESSKMQATPGKKLFGLKVVDHDGERVSFGYSVLRYAGKMLSHFIFFIGHVMVAFTEKKVGLHDILAKTYVIYDQDERK